MRLQEYIQKLQQILETEGDLELIYSRDDEGNGYDNVQYSPSVQFFNINYFEVIAEKDLEEYEEDDYTKVCCIN